MPGHLHISESSKAGKYFHCSYKSSHVSNWDLDAPQLPAVPGAAGEVALAATGMTRVSHERKEQAPREDSRNQNQVQVVLVRYFMPRSISINSEYPLRPYWEGLFWFVCLLLNVGRKENPKHLEQIEIFPPNIFFFTVGICIETSIFWSVVLNKCSKIFFWWKNIPVLNENYLFLTEKWFFFPLATRSKGKLQSCLILEHSVKDLDSVAIWKFGNPPGAFGGFYHLWAGWGRRAALPRSRFPQCVRW